MDSPERLAEAAWIHKLGPEAETLFTKGSERSLALSLRRSEAWSDEAQPTLAFDVPMAHPQSWPVYCTTTRHWIAGSFYVGNLENRIDMMLRRVKKPAIVVFESVHTAMGAWQGHGDNLDLVDLLVSVVTHPRLRMVVTATPDGWAQLRERKADSSWSSRRTRPATPSRGSSPRWSWRAAASTSPPRTRPSPRLSHWPAATSARSPRSAPRCACSAARSRGRAGARA
jgi:hypothetical protein